MAIISLIINLFMLVVFARVLLSWFPDIDRSNPLVQAIYDITEPVLRPIREILPPTGMLDLSPLVLIVILQILRVFLGV